MTDDLGLFLLPLICVNSGSVIWNKKPIWRTFSSKL